MGRQSASSIFAISRRLGVTVRLRGRSIIVTLPLLIGKAILAVVFLILRVVHRGGIRGIHPHVGRVLLHNEVAGHLMNDDALHIERIGHLIGHLLAVLREAVELGLALAHGPCLLSRLSSDTLMAQSHAGYNFYLYSRLRTIAGLARLLLYR
jgi:hypothetical protein